MFNTFLIHCIFFFFFFFFLKYFNQSDEQKYCAVPLCNNSTVNYGSNDPNSNSEIMFHPFPSDTVILEKWLKFCNIYVSVTNEYQKEQICSVHFNKDNYENSYTNEVKYIMIWYQFIF